MPLLEPAEQQIFDAARWAHCATYGYPKIDEKRHEWVVYGSNGPVYGTSVETLVDEAMKQ